MSAKRPRKGLADYADALALFRARGLCSCARTVRDHIKAHPDICPPDGASLTYHNKRFQWRDLERLADELAQKYPHRQPVSQGKAKL